MDRLSSFRWLWAVDFEFTAPAGDRPTPLCVVARELRTGKVVRIWLDGVPPASPPYGTGADSLFIAYYASAEMGCHLALDWPMPARVLDLFTEFRCRTSGLPTPCGSGLLGALAYFGLDGLAAVEKEGMRQLAMRGGPYTATEREELVDYCQTDVYALARLLPAMLPGLDLPRALLRGRYMSAGARMEWTGVPIDTDALERLRDGWDGIKARLIAEVDREYGVFVPTGRALAPDTLFGDAITREAGEYGIDPYRLADAADTLWRDERAIGADIAEAVATARKVTGLTPRRIDRWEDRGGDSSTWPGLDTLAREVAGACPALGMGRGYTIGDGPDECDYGDALWERLKRAPERPRAKHDSALIRRAAELVAASPDAAKPPPVPRSFSAARWSDWLVRNGIPWPRLASGALDLSDDAFRQMARLYPAVAPMRELRHALSQLRLNELAVGWDGRNRCLLSAFRARTGRNQPSNSRFIFGPSVWLRGLIRPASGQAIAYIDWSAQEIGIAAALSGDPAMMEAYTAGDPYLWLARVGGFAPAVATKLTHPAIRETFKVVYLAANYGMGERSLAALVGKPEAYARELLHLHRERFPTFWRWSDAALDHAMLRGRLWTVFGWSLHIGPDTKPTSLRNFPVQANGAEMLRLACCLATERGIGVCAPVHDALLVEAPAAEIGATVASTQAAMREASEIVLGGFRLRSDAKIVRHPDRYTDPRGVQMWETVTRLLMEVS